ncbi:MAG: cation:proton antiporter [Gemmatimonadota bacterium]|nr:MAG: cation:proton antiporter [Gemmatimonadota bacterium]
MAINVQRTASRSVGRLLTLVVIALLAALFRYLGPRPGIATGTMLLGFLLLSAFVAGEVARELRLPRITGYLVIGLLFGPSALQLLPRATVLDFRVINGVALSLIALQAGGELRIERIGARWRGIVMITLCQIVIVLLGVAGVVVLLSGLLPFLEGQTQRVALAVALIFGLVAVAKSPATTIAVITEMRASGPLTDTVLGVSVLKDVIVLLLIAALIPAAALLAEPGHHFDLQQLSEIALAILVALALGAAIGWLVRLYLWRINRQPILFVLAVAFGIVEFAGAVGLESESYIIMGMAAGFVVQNFSVQGPPFIEALEANSLPLYALFFAVAGADLDLAVIPAVWHVGMAIVLSRLVFLYLSTRLGAAIAGELQVIRQYAWMGFLAKAGVTLGLANIVRDRFATWGEAVAAIIIAMIAVNQLIGPPLFRFSILRAGESATV